MTKTESTSFVSIHGGHSRFGDGAGELEEIAEAYAAKGFEWVGLTEHIPPVSERHLFSHHVEQGETPASLLELFAEYFEVARRLQKEYRDRLRIFVGFETECYTGYVSHVERLRSRFKPDYIVGAVHHVRDITIDWKPETYAEAAEAVGVLDALYCEYFDQQFGLLEVLQPEVVGHFDLIRMHDKDYRQRIEKPEIRDRNASS